MHWFQITLNVRFKKDVYARNMRSERISKFTQCTMFVEANEVIYNLFAYKSN